MTLPPPSRSRSHAGAAAKPATVPTAPKSPKPLETNKPPKATIRKPAPRPAARRAKPAAPAESAAPAKKPKAAGKAASATKVTKRSAASARAPAGPAKPERMKLVRDSFTLPRSDVDLLVALKQRALKQGAEAKKSELVRAGIHALAALDDAQLRAALAGVPKLKTGRPEKKKGK
jgi:hypothetical protein